jgi:ATP-dependent Clp protease ATP-binding subunit ClpX
MIRLRSLKCSFCRRSEKDVTKLVAGPRVYICDRCVRAAAEIMAGHSGDGPPASTSRRRIFGRLHQFVRRMQRPTPPAGKEYHAVM